MYREMEAVSSSELKSYVDDLFALQRREIERFHDCFDPAKCIPLINHLIENEGTFFWSGIGKSGHIASKIAGTLMSLGERTAFFSVIDALHGDLGVIRPGDGICFLSKSGSGREILELIPYLKAKNVTVCSITSSAQSGLARSSDIVIEMPCPKELCPFNLTPTISSEIQLMIGDLIAATMRKVRQVTLSDYGLNHPQGQIGLRIHTGVVDVMVPREEVPTCHSEDPLRKVLDVFSARRCGCLVVVSRDNQVTGIFTDGDLRRSLITFGNDLLDKRLGELATPSPRVVTQESDVNDALLKMDSGGNAVSVIPVVNNNKDRILLGLLRMHDLVRLGIA